MVVQAMCLTANVCLSDLMSARFPAVSGDVRSVRNGQTDRRTRSCKVVQGRARRNENARRHKPSGRIPGAEEGAVRGTKCQVVPRSAARAALPRQRGAPDGGNHTPKTERPQDFLRSPAISRSIAFGLLCCGLLIQGACIVANLPPGATMPQEAHGAVGGHGCRRREPDPTLRHRKVRSPTIAAAGSPPAKW